MKLRMLVVLAVAISLAGCGVKGDLEKPSEQSQKAEKDPSKPPAPFGR